MQLNKSSGKLVTAILVFFIIILFFGILYNSNIEEKDELNLPNEEISVVRIKDKVIIVEIAINLQRAGLMNHNELEKDHGMLFIFEEEKIHSFWMKNMKFSIDIVWIDSNEYIVHIEKDLPPCEDNCVIYAPEKESKYVLEVESGFTDEHKINIGEPLELDLFDLDILN